MDAQCCNLNAAGPCDETNVRGMSGFETWGQFLGGLYLVATGLRRNTFTGGVLASMGSCLVYRGANCLLGLATHARRSTTHAHRPDPSIVNNPIDEASWESFPASDAPVFSGITR